MSGNGFSAGNKGLIEKDARQMAREWRGKWLSDIRVGQNYDVGPREKAADWATQWGLESLRYMLGDESVAPGCTEVVLEALQLHGGARFCLRGLIGWKISR